MRRSFDRAADRFDETRSYPDELMRQVLGSLSHILEGGNDVLEAGVGTGRFAQPLQRMGFTVVGVDVSGRMLARAASKGTRDLLRGDVCALPFADGAFDDALSVHVTHLISDWRCALREIGRVTRRNLVSVASDKGGSGPEELRTRYRSACEGLGFVVRHVGPMERELTRLLAPDSVVHVARHEHPVDVARMIDDYGSRTYSDLWDVPEDVHSKAVAALREGYEGVHSLMCVEDVSLLVWSAERVRAFAAGGL